MTEEYRYLLTQSPAITAQPHQPLGCPRVFALASRLLAVLNSHMVCSLVTFNSLFKNISFFIPFFIIWARPQHCSFSTFFPPKHLAALMMTDNLFSLYLLSPDCISCSGVFCLMEPHLLMDFAGGSLGKEPTCQCRGHKGCRFDPRVWKILWRRKWQPTPVFLPGKFHGQRVVWRATVPGITKSRTRLSAHTYIHTYLLMYFWKEVFTLSVFINSVTVSSHIS